MRHFALFIWFVFCFVGNAFSQLDITNLYVRPPFKADFSYYFDQKNVTIQIANPQGKAFPRLALEGSIKGQTKGQTNGVEIKLHRLGQQPFGIQANQGIKILNQQEIDGVFATQAIETVNFDKNNFNSLANRLPADCYDYILKVINFDTGQPLGEEAVTEICITSVSQPILLSPQDGLVADDLNKSPLIFSWTPSDGSFKNLEYQLEMVELLPGQEPNQAFQSNTLFAQNTVPGHQNNFIWKVNENQYLRNGYQYAWRVKLQELNGGSKEGYEFENGGFSEVWTFTYAQETKEEPNEEVEVAKVNNIKIADCSACTFTPPANQTESTAHLEKGKFFYIGNSNGYEVLVTAVSSGSGTGTVTFNPLTMDPVKRQGQSLITSASVMPFQVAFEGVKVNSEGVMFAGKVTSVKTADGTPSLMPDATLPDGLPDFSTFGDDLANEAAENLVNPQRINQKLNDHLKKISDYIDKLAAAPAEAANSAGFKTPLGFKTDIGGVNTTIAFENFLFTPTSNQFDVITILDEKESGVLIPLGFRGACLGISGACQDYTLFLLKDMPISNLKLKGKKETIEKSTHLTYNSKAGITNLHIHAEYEFKENVLVLKEGTGRVKATLMADTKNGFSDWHAEVSMPAFKAYGIEDFQFELGGKAFYDHSEKKNPDGMDRMLAKLEPKIKTNDKGDLALLKENKWQGFYMPKLKVQLPEIFKADQKEHVNVSVENMVIDSRGISGSIGAENVFGIGAGNLDGWYYSLDKLDLTIFNNSFIESSAAGKIVLPISGKPDQNATQLDYTNTLTANETSGKLAYQFVIKPNEDVKVPIWKANMKLLASSNISVTVGDENVNKGELTAKAVLNGGITFKSPEIGEILPSYDLKLMDFQNLKIQSFEPYIDMGSIKSEALKEGSELYKKGTDFVGSLASPQHYLVGSAATSGSPVTLDEFVPITKLGNPTQIGFYFHGTLSLTDIPCAPAAGMGMAVLANVSFNAATQRPEFSFKGIELEDVNVKGELGPLSIEGRLKFFREHAVFGNGFKGEVAAKFPMGIAIKAEAQFGAKADVSYWNVYASAKIPGGVPLVGPLMLSGFGGGAYHNMASSFNATAKTLPSETPPYIPKKNANGLMATVFFKMADEALMKGVATLEVAWDAGGVTNVGLKGDIDMFNQEESNNKGILHGTVKVNYDFLNSIFDLKGGVSGGIKGPGTGDIVKVDAENTLWLHVAGEQQFFQLGNPEESVDPTTSNTVSNRVKVTVLSFLEGNAYFWTGNGSMPNIPLPQGINRETLQRMGYKSFKELGFTNASGGLMFGAAVGFPSPLGKYEELRFLIFYMKLKAVFGFDVQLAKYTEPCGASTQPPGMNGWYAMGQIYGQVGFAFGVHVDVWFYEGDIEVASLEATAIMQGGLPNPMWFKGMLNGRYSVLEGLIEGEMNFKVAVGDVCIPDTPPTDPFDLPLIAEVYPAVNKKIDIMDNPTVVFNYPVSKEIEITSTMPNKDGEGGTTLRIETFRIDVNLSMKRLSGKQTTGCESEINDSGELRLSSDGLRALFYRNWAFAPDSRYELKVVGTPKRLENGKWQVMKVTKKTATKSIGEDKTQIEFAQFDTGPCPTKLSKGTIAISYPYEGQRFVLQREFDNQGVIALNKKMCCVGSDCGEGKPYDLVMRFNTEDNPSVNIDAAVAVNFGGNESAQTLTFKLPNMPNEKFIKMQLIKKPNKAYFENLNAMNEFRANRNKESFQLKNSQILQNSASNKTDKLKTGSRYEAMNNYANVGMDDVKNEAKSQSNVKVKVARTEGTNTLKIEGREVKLTETSYFRTSKFNTIQSKVNAIDATAKGKIYSSSYITAEFAAAEGFDSFDIGAKSVEIREEQKFLQPIIGLEFAHMLSTWYLSKVFSYKVANDISRNWGGNFLQLQERAGNSNGLLPVVYSNCLQPFEIQEIPLKLLFPNAGKLNNQPLKK